MTGWIDLNAAYNISYKNSTQLHRKADYSAPLEDFDKYSEADQQRIMQRLATIQAALATT